MTKKSNEIKLSEIDALKVQVAKAKVVIMNLQGERDFWKNKYEFETAQKEYGELEQSLRVLYKAGGLSFNPNEMKWIKPEN